MPWEDQDPFEKGESTRAMLVLDEMGLSGKQNEVLLMSCKVVRFTVESKVKPADYEQARGYVELEPKDLWIHVPVYNPAQLVDNAGSVRLFGEVFRYIARELDLSVFDTASRRLDLRTAIQDQKDEQRGGVKIGQSPTKKQTEAL